MYLGTCVDSLSVKLNKLYLSAVEYPTTDHESRPTDDFFFKFCLTGRNFKAFDTGRVLETLDVMGLSKTLLALFLIRILAKIVRCNIFRLDFYFYFFRKAEKLPLKILVKLKY